MHAPTVLVLALLPLLASVPHAQPRGASCSPAACGNLIIKYPFWLRGKQPSHCGYPTFGVTCDDPTGVTPPSLNGSYLRVLEIHYSNSSVVAFHSNLAERNACSATRFNMSTSFALSLLAVSSANWELFLCANCSGPPLSGSLQMNCPGSGAWFVYLARRYDPAGDLVQPMASLGCQYSVVPVLPGSELRALDNYTGLVRRGFMLEWTVPGDCAACTASGGQCRWYEAGVNAFRCLCPSGRLQPTICGELLIL